MKLAICKGSLILSHEGSRELLDFVFALSLTSFAWSIGGKDITAAPQWCCGWIGYSPHSKLRFASLSAAGFAA